MTTVIEVRDLSKVYRLGAIGTGALREDLVRWWAMRIRWTPCLSAAPLRMKCDVSLDGARTKVLAWLRFYNESPPHSTLGDRTLCKFASWAELTPAMKCESSNSERAQTPSC